MIYCVIPKALEGELYEKLKAYYADDPTVTLTHGSPRLRAIPAIVRVCSVSLKTSTARSTFT